MKPLNKLNTLRLSKMQLHYKVTLEIIVEVFRNNSKTIVDVEFNPFEIKEINPSKNNDKLIDDTADLYFGLLNHLKSNINIIYLVLNLQYLPSNCFTCYIEDLSNILKSYENLTVLELFFDPGFKINLNNKSRNFFEKIKSKKLTRLALKGNFIYKEYDSNNLKCNISDINMEPLSKILHDNKESLKELSLLSLSGKFRPTEIFYNRLSQLKNLESLEISTCLDSKSTMNLLESISKVSSLKSLKLVISKIIKNIDNIDNSSFLNLPLIFPNLEFLSIEFLKSIYHISSKQNIVNDLIQIFCRNLPDLKELHLNGYFSYKSKLSKEELYLYPNPSNISKFSDKSIYFEAELSNNFLQAFRSLKKLRKLSFFNLYFQYQDFYEIIKSIHSFKELEELEISKIKGVLNDSYYKNAQMPYLIKDDIIQFKTLYNLKTLKICVEVWSKQGSKGVNYDLALDALCYLPNVTNLSITCPPPTDNLADKNIILRKLCKMIEAFNLLENIKIVDLRDSLNSEDFDFSTSLCTSISSLIYVKNIYFWLCDANAIRKFFINESFAKSSKNLFSFYAYIFVYNLQFITNDEIKILSKHSYRDFVIYQMNIIF